MVVTHFFPLSCAITSMGVIRFVGRRIVDSLRSRPSRRNRTDPSFFLTARMLLQNNEASLHSRRIPCFTYWSIMSRIGTLTPCATGTYFCMWGVFVLMGIFTWIPLALPRSNGCLLNAPRCFWNILRAVRRMCRGRCEIWKESKNSTSDIGWSFSKDISVKDALFSTVLVMDG